MATGGRDGEIPRGRNGGGSITGGREGMGGQHTGMGNTRRVLTAQGQELMREMEGQKKTDYQEV